MTSTVELTQSQRSYTCPMWLTQVIITILKLRQYSTRQSETYWRSYGVSAGVNR